MQEPALFMLLLGCRVRGRNTEQHDIFFGFGQSIKDLVPAIQQFWPETKGNIHIDAWRRVTTIDGYNITIIGIDQPKHGNQNSNEVFFINLGGYKENEFDEFHYKVLVVAENLDDAKIKAKKKHSLNIVRLRSHPDIQTPHLISTINLVLISMIATD